MLVGRTLAGLGGQMLALGIGWELYERTSSALALGIVGLVQILPILLLALATGHVADTYDRKSVAIASQIVLIVASAGLVAISASQGSLAAVYGFLLLLGIGSAFSNPAVVTLPAEILPEEAFENSATWTNSVGQVASIAGPALGGVLIAAFHGTTVVYGFNALAELTFAVMLLFVRGRPAQRRPVVKDEPPSLRSLGEGIAFLRRNPIILSAISLDLFAVLFGGATTLLPIFARDILQVGPEGLGWLRAAPSIGALLVVLVLAHQPPMQRAGATLLAVVAGFGLATIVFGLSQSFWLSLLMLAVLGGMDSVSMVVRDTLMLTRTPHEMRGRVAAIEGLFTSSSNQLGGFESGVTAQLFGPILSVVGGGIGTILVVLFVALTRPELRLLTTLRARPVDTPTLPEMSGSG